MAIQSSPAGLFPTFWCEKSGPPPPTRERVALDFRALIPAPGQRLDPGDRVGRYEILFPLASGGQGEVWLGRLRAEHGFEKFFVLKFMLPEGANGAAERAMFLDEARLAARVSHPNVAQVIELGEAKGLLYMVMERVEGDSLSRLTRRKLGTDTAAETPLGVILRVMADICDGLHAAHEATDAEGRPLGLVHRDVSPQNILVSLTGHAKLIDFGVAKAKVRLSAEISTSTIKGKLRYVAPEQAMAAPDVDRRADIWSIGVVLFQLITGRMPVDGDSDAAVLRRLLSLKEALVLPPGSPELLNQLMAKTLAPAPADRFPTALDLKQALEQALAQLSPGTSHETVAAYFGPALVEVALAQSQALASAEAALVGRDHAGELFLGEGPAQSQGNGAGASTVVPAGWLKRPRTWVSALMTLALGAALAVGTWLGATKADDRPDLPGAPASVVKKLPASADVTHPPVAVVPNAVPPTDSPPPVATGASGVRSTRRPPQSSDAMRATKPRRTLAPAPDAKPRALDNPYQ